MDNLQKRLTTMMSEFKSNYGNSFNFTGEQVNMDLNKLVMVLQDGSKQVSDIKGISSTMITDLHYLLTLEKLLTRVKAGTFQLCDWTTPEQERLARMDIELKDFVDKSSDDNDTRQSKKLKTDDKWSPVNVDKWSPHMPPHFEQDKIYQIPHLDLASLAGLCQKPLLFRQEAMNLVNTLNAAKNHQPSSEAVKCRGVSVQGAPGIGKSCTVWAWLLSLIANSVVKSVIWIHLRLETAVCVRMNQTSISKANFQTTIDEDFTQLISVLQSETDQVIVLDGLLNTIDTHQKLTRILESNESCFHVQVASLSFVHKPSVRDVMEDELGIVFHHMYPWSLEDYYMACRDTVFFESVKQYLIDDIEKKTYTDDQIQELIAQKFYYAGVSARYMFTRTIQEIKHKIQFALQTIKNANDHYSLLTGENSTLTTNRLVVRHTPGDACFYVSKYVAMMLVDKCSEQILDTLYKTANRIQNPTFRGWVFELNIIDSCSHSPFYLYNQDGNRRLITENNELTTVSIDDGKITFHPPVKSVDELNLKLMKPKKWNNAGFDMSMMERLDDQGKEYAFRFFQVTINPNHAFELKHYLAHAIKFHNLFKVQIPIISITMVVPTESKDSDKPFCKEINSGNVTFVDDIAIYRHDNDKDHPLARWINYKYEKHIPVCGFKAHKEYYTYSSA